MCLLTNGACFQPLCLAVAVVPGLCQHKIPISVLLFPWILCVLAIDLVYQVLHVTLILRAQRKAGR